MYLIVILVIGEKNYHRQCGILSMPSIDQYLQFHIHCLKNQKKCVTSTVSSAVGNRFLQTYEERDKRCLKIQICSLEVTIIGPLSSRTLGLECEMVISQKNCNREVIEAIGQLEWALANERHV